HDHVEAGGLAGAVRPQKAHHFAAVDRQRYVFDDRAFAVDLAQTRCAQAPRGVEGRTAQAAGGGGLGEGKLSTQNRPQFFAPGWRRQASMAASARARGVARERTRPPGAAEFGPPNAW